MNLERERERKGKAGGGEEDLKRETEWCLDYIFVPQG